MGEACVIFDFDGVIANTEELHLAAYNQVLLTSAEAIGRVIHITPERYFSRYIVFGNLEAFRLMLQDQGINPPRALLDKLCTLKDKIMDGHMGEAPAPMPGVTEFIKYLASRDVPCGICSGARRAEIMALLKAFTLERYFPVIVAIEDVARGKPDPRGYSLAFDRINALRDGNLHIAKSLVIEDTEGGAAAAHDAKLRVLGVATTSSLDSVRKWADFPFEHLAQVPLRQLEQILGLPARPLN